MPLAFPSRKLLGEGTVCPAKRPPPTLLVALKIQCQHDIMVSYQFVIRSELFQEAPNASTSTA
jgi:hypothetical protein